jgi:hypothetical protein
MDYIWRGFPLQAVKAVCYGSTLYYLLLPWAWLAFNVFHPNISHVITLAAVLVLGYSPQCCYCRWFCLFATILTAFYAARYCAGGF